MDFRVQRNVSRGWGAGRRGTFNPPLDGFERREAADRSFPIRTSERSRHPGCKRTHRVGRQGNDAQLRRFRCGVIEKST